MEAPDLRALKRLALRRYLMLFPVLGACFFLPAWSLKYWEGWLYIFVVAAPVGLFGFYLFRTDPKLLERRMRTREKRREQKLVIALSALAFPLTLILPGFDKRLGWSKVPLVVQLVSFALVLLGYRMITAVFRANSFHSGWSRSREAKRWFPPGPTPSSGIPCCSSMIVQSVHAAALGPYWALIPTVLFLLVLVPRILGEEKELTENLEGYREYTQKVRYRLIPGLW